jgi:hypothetical protein
MSGPKWRLVVVICALAPWHGVCPGRPSTHDPPHESGS